MPNAIVSGKQAAASLASLVSDASGDNTKAMMGDGTFAVVAIAANNLTDVVSASSARGNLGVHANRHTVTAGEDTAATADIATGGSSISAQIVQILRSGAVVTGDAVVSTSAGTLTVADGATYVLTAGDVINWIAIG